MKKSTTNLWDGKGRKRIVVPKEVLKNRIVNNSLLNHLYITDLGFYPVASNHNTLRENGCAELIIILCVDGKGRYKTGTGNYEVLPGQFFMLPPHQMHQYEADADDPWSIYWLRAGGNNVVKLCSQTAAKKCFKPTYITNIKEVCGVFDDLYSTLENGYGTNHINYANMTLQHALALLLFRSQEDKKGVLSLTDKVVNFMKEQISVQYSLAELASKFCYSPSHFSKILKQETGYSPIDYFILLKIQESCRFLDLNQMKIYEIALKVGYSDQYHFSKIFKKIMHVSPEQYRKARKG